MWLTKGWNFSRCWHGVYSSIMSDNVSPPQLCSSATWTWPAPVWKQARTLPGSLLPVWLGPCWSCLETSWWWFPPLISSSCTLPSILHRLSGLCDFLVEVTVMPCSMVESMESCWCFRPSFYTCCCVAFCYSSLFHLWFISMDRDTAVTGPLSYPLKFTESVSGICTGLSWILPIAYSCAMFSPGANHYGLEEPSSCIEGCQTAVNQNWVLIDFLSLFIPCYDNSL